MPLSISLDDPRWFLDSLTEHVLQPLDTASKTLSRELCELETERDALESFRTQVERIETESHSQIPMPRTTEPRAKTGTDIARAAYRRTFFAIDHQEDVYGETLVESIAEEFGSDFAAALRPGSNVQFSPQFKQALLSTAEKSIHERESLMSCIETEQQSVERATETLSSVLETLDSSVIPSWYRGQFQDELDEVLDARQRTLHDRTQSFDNHDFCAYLYDDAVWTYPVLTSVARLRESVAMD